MGNPSFKQKTVCILKNLIQDIISDVTFSEFVAWRRFHFHANEVIIQEGETGKSLYFIEEGNLRLTVMVMLENQRHMQTGLCDVSHGDIFGEGCLYQSQQHKASVTAISDGCLLEINGERLSIYLDAHPIRGYLFFKKLFETLTERLNRANHRVEHLLAWGLKAHDISKHL